MSQLQDNNFLILRPSIIYVCDETGDAAHFRGGDNEIYPVSDISNPKLLEMTMSSLLEVEVMSYQGLLDKCFSASILTDKSELDEILQGLIDAGLLFSTLSESPLTDLQRFLVRTGVYSDSIVKTLLSKTISVYSASSLHRQRILETLSNYGLEVVVGSFENTVTKNIASIDISLVIGDYTNDDFFEKLNCYALKSKIPWLMIRQAGFNLAQMGPLFVPGETACFNCLLQRMSSQRDNPDQYKLFYAKQFAQPVSVWNEHDTDYIVDKACKVILRYLISGIVDIPLETLVGKSRFIELGDMSSETEKLLRLPSCAVCKGS